MTQEKSTWTCPTCQDTVSTPYCANCGERLMDPRALTVHGLFHQLLHFLSSVDGRVTRSLIALLRYPGSLTLSYQQGQRRVYVPPFRLFIIANILFFAVQTLTRIDIVAPPLAADLQIQDWSGLAQSLVAERLKSTGMSLERLALLFNQAVVLNAKSLVILMVLPFSILVSLLFVRQHKPILIHVVFSLHMYVFVLLLYCVALFVIAIDAKLGGGGLESIVLDVIITVVLFLVCAGYLYIAIGRVYQDRGISRLLKTTLLAVAVAAILVGYRFAIFLFTLYTT